MSSCNCQQQFFLECYVFEILLISIFSHLTLDHDSSGLGIALHKRDWSAINIDILEAALKPERKMRIMYRANLNFERFDKYFSELLKKGLIEEHSDHDGKTAYLITKRGKTLLDCLRKAREIFSEC